MAGNYYNEWDKYAAAWLRNLINAGHLPAGEVDERSIAEVHPDDLSGFIQCHFFAGIGGWALAARLASWPDDRELWTGSLPCQPYSVAGAQRGHDDERDLWHHQLRLITARRPAVFMGEQVAAAIGKGWLDRLFLDLSTLGYSGDAAVIPACAVNAPHRRDRIFAVAELGSGVLDHGGSEGLERLAGDGDDEAGRPVADRSVAETGLGNCGVARNADELSASTERQQRGGQLGWAGGDPETRVVGVASDADRLVSQQRSAIDTRSDQGSGANVRPGSSRDDTGRMWDSGAYILGHDGKARRVKPGIRLLAHGVPARVGKLRAYGNAIVPQIAAEVMAAYMECRP